MLPSSASGPGRRGQRVKHRWAYPWPYQACLWAVESLVELEQGYSVWMEMVEVLVGAGGIWFMAEFALGVEVGWFVAIALDWRVGMELVGREEFACFQMVEWLRWSLVSAWMMVAFAEVLALLSHLAILNHLVQLKLVSHHFHRYLVLKMRVGSKLNRFGLVLGSHPMVVHSKEANPYPS